MSMKFSIIIFYMAALAGAGMFVAVLAIYERTSVTFWQLVIKWHESH